LTPERLRELREWHLRQSRFMSGDVLAFRWRETLLASVPALLDAAEERDRLLDERDQMRARYADLQIACDMYEASIDRLTTFVDEEYGMQPVAESSEALVSMLEGLAFERRQQDEAERKERDRLRARVAELEAKFASQGGYHG